MSEALLTHTGHLDKIKAKATEEAGKDFKKLLSESEYLDVLTDGSEQDIQDFIQELYLHNHKENVFYLQSAGNSAVTFANSLLNDRNQNH